MLVVDLDLFELAVRLNLSHQIKVFLEPRIDPEQDLINLDLLQP